LLPLLLPWTGIVKNVIFTPIAKAVGTEMDHAVRLGFSHDEHLTGILLTEETNPWVVLVMKTIETFISKPAFHSLARL